MIFLQKLFQFLQEVLIEKYESEKAIAYVEKYVEKLQQKMEQKENGKDLTEITRMLFDKLYELELLKEEWNNLLQETEVILYSEPQKRRNKKKMEVKEQYSYQDKVKEFELWMKKHFDLEIHLEQLLLYFLCSRH